VRTALEQKHDWEGAVRTGGAQAPCTLKRGPHRDAQAGSLEVKGTITPSGEATAVLLL
jgi:hypothetical protein